MSISMDSISQLLKKVFGFTALRPGQEEVVAAVLAGEDVLAVMPTGSGKSLCYQLPAVAQGGLTVVVSPLIALMQDQTRQMRAHGVGAFSLNSGQPPAENARAYEAVRSGKARLLYVAPERLFREELLELLVNAGAGRLVVDEAHCVSQWGHDFRPEYLQLRDAADCLGDVQILAFTATADQATRSDIGSRLFRKPSRVFVHGFDRPNIRLAMSPKENAGRQVLRFVKDHPGKSGIVYCFSRKDTEEYSELLRDAGVNALPYHAGMDMATRRANQDKFQLEDGVVMAATIAFGMGIDKPDVRFVCHAAMPKNIESYYQEIGRAGRDGLPADTLMLYGLDDIRLRKFQIQDSDASDEQKRVETQRLNALLALCETPRCRRQTLLDYFGEESSPCGNCDLCESGCRVEDGTIAAQKVMSAMVRTGQCFATEHLVSLLMGRKTEAIERLGHHDLPTFGVGRDKDANYWRAVFRQLMAAGLVSLDIVNHGRWVMAPRGWEVLRGQERVQIRSGLSRPEKRRLEKVRSGRRKAVSQNKAAVRESRLLTALKLLRYSLAKEQGVPAFVVFSDRTLLEMESELPVSLEQMASLYGVGEAKLAKYGQPFLDLLASHRKAGAARQENPPAAEPPGQRAATRASVRPGRSSGGGDDGIGNPGAGGTSKGETAHPRREGAPFKDVRGKKDSGDGPEGSCTVHEDLKQTVRAALAGTRDWTEFQTRLGAHGLQLLEKGGGLALYAKPSGKYLCKASEAGPGYSKLIQRFGAPFPGHAHGWLAEKVLGKQGDT